MDASRSKIKSTLTGCGKHPNKVDWLAFEDSIYALYMIRDLKIPVAEILLAMEGRSYHIRLLHSLLKRVKAEGVTSAILAIVASWVGKGLRMMRPPRKITWP